MAAWGTTNWTRSLEVESQKVDVTPSKENIRSVLKLISGLDRIQDAPPNSVSGKVWYYTRVFFGRTPWVTCFCFIIFTVTFSLTADGNMQLTDDLSKHNFESESVLSIAVLIYSVCVNFFVYLFCLLGSRFCLAKRFSKWGSNCLCKLYFLRIWEGLLFCLTCVSLLLVGLDGFGIIANAVSLASIKVVCDLDNGNEIPRYVQLMKDDDILTAFLKVDQVQNSDIVSFCGDMKVVREDLNKFWYANFIALVAQVILTFSAYQNYVITTAVYQSSLFGSDIDKEVEKKRLEKERAKELKKQQRKDRKAERKNMELTLGSDKDKGYSKKEKRKTNDSTPNAYASSTQNSAYASSTNNDSAYGAVPETSDAAATNYADDDSSDAMDFNTGGDKDKAKDTGGAFDGGEWWKEQNF